MTIIADENISRTLISHLRNKDFKVLAIRETNRGESDRAIIDIVKNNKGILLTEDKDFGEWVFAHDLKDINVILLRYEKKDQLLIFENLTKTLTQWVEEPTHRFVTITADKIRQRTL